jgi:hypothetical protein
MKLNHLTVTVSNVPETLSDDYGMVLTVMPALVTARGFGMTSPRLVNPQVNQLQERRTRVSAPHERN